MHTDTHTHTHRGAEDKGTASTALRCTGMDEMRTELRGRCPPVSSMCRDGGRRSGGQTGRKVLWAAYDKKQTHITPK